MAAAVDSGKSRSDSVDNAISQIQRQFGKGVYYAAWRP